MNLILEGTIFKAKQGKYIGTVGNLLANIEKQDFSHFLSLFTLKNFLSCLMKEGCHLNFLILHDICQPL